MGGLSIVFHTYTHTSNEHLPTLFHPQNQPLGHWVGRMRYLHRNGKLEESREQRLKDIGFEFIMQKTSEVKFSVVWDKSYQALKAFRDMNGHVEVPNAYKPQPDMAELDGWITRQRKHFRDGKLPDHLKVKIVELGINLGGRGRPFGIETEDIFSQNYKALAEYAAEHGDADVPEKYDEDRELGEIQTCWVTKTWSASFLNPLNLTLSIMHKYFSRQMGEGSTRGLWRCDAPRRSCLVAQSDWIQFLSRKEDIQDQGD